MSLPIPAVELVRAAGVALVFLLILVAAETWRRLRHPPVEWTRKLVHVAGGVVSGTFPWLFSTHWTVLLLGVSSFAVLLAGKRLGWLGSVAGVERRSAGELLFPGSVYLLFVIARHHPVFYVIALFTLVFADTAAAILGVAYGRHTYMVHTNRKSLEGSAAFLLVTFIGVHTLLLLGTDTSRLGSVLIAAQLALLITSFEAISMRGNDNLIVPLMTYYLLLKLTPAPWGGIALQLAVQVGILAGMVLLSRLTGFVTLAGAIAAHLTLYAAFSLGGPAWSIAPLLALAGFLGFRRLSPSDPRSMAPQHEVSQVFYVSIVPVLLLFLDNAFATLFQPGHPLGVGHPFFVPFVGAFAATLAIVAYRALRRRLERAAAAAAWAIPLAWAAVAPLAVSLGPLGSRPFGLALALTAGSTVLGLLFYLVAGRWSEPTATSTWDLRVRAACVAVAAAAVLPFAIEAAR